MPDGFDGHPRQTTSLRGNRFYRRPERPHCFGLSLFRQSSLRHKCRCVGGTHYLRRWHKQTPYAKPKDFVFPSMREGGRVPNCSSIFCSDYLIPAKAAGVPIPDGHRWGLHNLRHSLSNWVVNKAKENPKTVQGILGHSRIQTTLDLYTDEDLDEMIAAQDKFLDAVGFEKETVHRPMRCGCKCGLDFWAPFLPTC
jgi:Phage integrase family